MPSHASKQGRARGMLRSRRPLALAAAIAVLTVCLVAVLRTRPVPYPSAGALSLQDGVPEMQVAPVVACPPVLVQGVLRGPAAPAAGARDLATVYVITPTYPRAVQVPEMTRLAQTLMLTSNVFWVVTEDAAQRTPAVTEILERSGLPHVHILGLKPEKYSKEAGFKGAVPRGVSNRMAALQWLRENAEKGVFYFADDDNTYDYRLFAELARTRRASAFPVGLVTQAGLSTPVVRNGAVVGFYDGWIGGRTFPMDMAGFAVSVQLLLEHPKAAMPFTAGYEEDGFLKSLGLKKDDLEPLADNCTKILVWHTQTKQPRVPFTQVDPDKYRGTNMEALRRIVNPSCCRRPRTQPASSAAPRSAAGRPTLSGSSSSANGTGPPTVANATAQGRARGGAPAATPSAAGRRRPTKAVNGSGTAVTSASGNTSQLMSNVGATRRRGWDGGAASRGRLGSGAGSLRGKSRADVKPSVKPANPPVSRRPIGRRRPTVRSNRPLSPPAQLKSNRSASQSQLFRLRPKYAKSKAAEFKGIQSIYPQFKYLQSNGVQSRNAKSENDQSDGVQPRYAQPKGSQSKNVQSSGVQPRYVQPKNVQSNGIQSKYAQSRYAQSKNAQFDGVQSGYAQTQHPEPRLNALSLAPVLSHSQSGMTSPSGRVISTPESGSHSAQPSSAPRNSSVFPTPFPSFLQHSSFPSHVSFSASLPQSSVSTHSNVSLRRYNLSSSHTPLSSSQTPLSQSQTPFSPSQTPLSPSKAPFLPSQNLRSPSKTPLSPSLTSFSPSQSPISKFQSPPSPSRTAVSPLGASLSPPSPALPEPLSRGGRPAGAGQTP
ncbi:DNA-directed RNA polymerase II subunit RPB1-like isoform X1 [Amphibalanus amphitrite]|uniref:DNA-directed RNA polymerase II subunit RPB1-like isoform X1 n=1 Tax=Amphibalanus amphitrite TaxID=1232801 RepID=UPI001C927B9D|nr:DNA-directed RNA polymerase II subunit RPB1-like isoform X1 [Amphibalanus amphitrite]